METSNLPVPFQHCKVPLCASSFLIQIDIDPDDSATCFFIAPSC